MEDIFSQLSVLNLVDSDLIYILTEVLNFYESRLFTFLSNFLN